MPAAAAATSASASRALSLSISAHCSRTASALPSVDLPLPGARVWVCVWGGGRGAECNGSKGQCGAPATQARRAQMAAAVWSGDAGGCTHSVALVSGVGCHLVSP
jgi:hypothetical protein